MSVQSDNPTLSVILDGFTNAADSLAKASAFALSDDPMKWKWIPICVDHALYTAAVTCLASDLSFVIHGDVHRWSRRNVPTEEMYQEVRHHLSVNGCEVRGPYRIAWEVPLPENQKKPSEKQKKQGKKGNLIEFWTALARVQDASWYMAQYCITRPLVLSDDDLYWIYKLHDEIRNPLAHYIPVTREISIKEAARACRTGAWAAAFLLADSLSPRVIHIEQETREAIADSYNVIADKASECEHQC